MAQLKMTFVGIILSALLLNISCSDDKPKVNESLSLPEMPDRLGHTKEQIKFWHEHFLDYWALTLDNSESLIYEDKGGDNYFISYSLKSGIVVIAMFGRRNITKETVVADAKEMFDMAEEFGFSNRISRESNKEEVTSVLGHKTFSKLRCQISTNLSDRAITQAFFYAAGDL